MSKEQYQPTPDEIKKAEDMMTNKQKMMSEDRNDTYEHAFSKGLFKGYGHKIIRYGNGEPVKDLERLENKGDLIEFKKQKKEKPYSTI